MSQNTLSRRNFMTGIAVGGTAATLASPAVAVAAEPVVTATYPLATPAASAGPIKMLCTTRFLRLKSNRFVRLERMWTS